MHDIAGHIENVLTELPNHMISDDKNLFGEMFAVFKAEKEKKRCCDWRRILLLLTQHLYTKIDGKMHMLLRTLTEIQRILYLPDEYRTATQVLRLHNSCFEHYVLMKEFFSGKLLSVTRDRLFGKYMHNLLVHAPTQYRLVSGVAINSEDEEREFNNIKTLSSGTTNNRPGHLIGNLIVRREVKSRCQEKYEYEKNRDYCS